MEVIFISRRRQKQKFLNVKKKREINYLIYISESRVAYLMESALSVFPKNRELANRYVLLANKIAQGAKISIPKQYRIYICKGCKKLILPGKNCYYRIRSLKGQGSHLTITCLDCGKRLRIYFKKKKAVRVKKPRNPTKKKTNQELNSNIFPKNDDENQDLEEDLEE